LILTKLLCRDLKDGEALIVKGALQYSDFEGNADTFMCKTRKSPSSTGSFIAMNVLNVGDDAEPEDQYDEKRVARELAIFSAVIKEVEEPKITTGYYGFGNSEVFFEAC